MKQGELFAVLVKNKIQDETRSWIFVFLERIVRLLIINDGVNNVFGLFHLIGRHYPNDLIILSSETKLFVIGILIDIGCISF